MVTIDDFAKLEFKVGTIISAEEIDGSDRLLKLQVDFGPKVLVGENNESETSSEILHNVQDDSTEVIDHIEPGEEATNEIRQILSGIKQWFKPADLVGKQFVFITNLAPRKMMGLESQGMIMAAEGEEKPIPLTVSEKVPNGSKIR
jgi:methionyl-tRNA synthetase